MTSLSHAPATLAGPLPEDALELLRSMLVIRIFEEQVQDLFTRNLVRGSTHLCQGQEGVVVGACSALAPGDTMACTYRGHGAVLAIGAPVDAAFGEILGREGGLCRGRGGSMHLADLSRGALGSNAIVGAHLPLVVGAAWSAQYRGSGEVSLAFCGDGSTNIGAFHESLNLAAIWRLPAVFVIENNQYGEYSPVAATTPIVRLCERAASYGMPGVFVDGNDVVAVRAEVGAAVRRARGGEGPTLIEANTYRQVGHSRSDPGAYRPEGELERWMELDPIKRLREALVEQGMASLPVLEDLSGEVGRQVASARDRALGWPAPDPSGLHDGVFA